MPPIDLAQAAQATIAQIQNRLGKSSN